MNNAFTKGKFKKWYVSRFYKSCVFSGINYNKWLSMQPNKLQDKILGKAKGDLFRCNTEVNPVNYSSKLSLAELKARQKL